MIKNANYVDLTSDSPVIGGANKKNVTLPVSNKNVTVPVLEKNVAINARTLSPRNGTPQQTVNLNPTCPKHTKQPKSIDQSTDSQSMSKLLMFVIVTPGTHYVTSCISWVCSYATILVFILSGKENIQLPTLTEEDRGLLNQALYGNGPEEEMVSAVSLSVS